MQGTGDSLQVELGILLAEHVAAIGVDEHIEFTAVLDHHELRTAPGIGRRQVLLDPALWIGGVDPLQLFVGADPVVAGLDLEQIAVHQRVELRLEQA